MPKKTDRETVEEHWEYTEKVILKMLELCKQLYKDGMIHGLRHGREDALKNKTSQKT